MAAEHELERMLVRLVGDASQFEAMMKGAVETVNTEAAKIASATKAATDAANASLSNLGTGGLAAFNTAIEEAIRKQAEFAAQFPKVVNDAQMNDITANWTRLTEEITAAGQAAGITERQITNAITGAFGQSQALADQMSAPPPVPVVPVLDPASLPDQIKLTADQINDSKIFALQIYGDERDLRQKIEEATTQAELKQAIVSISGDPAQYNDILAEAVGAAQRFTATLNLEANATKFDQQLGEVVDLKDRSRDIMLRIWGDDRGLRTQIEEAQTFAQMRQVVVSITGDPSLFDRVIQAASGDLAGLQAGQATYNAKVEELNSLLNRNLITQEQLNTAMGAINTGGARIDEYKALIDSAITKHAEFAKSFPQVVNDTQMQQLNDNWNRLSGEILATGTVAGKTLQDMTNELGNAKKQADELTSSLIAAAVKEAAGPVVPVARAVTDKEEAAMDRNAAKIIRETETAAESYARKVAELGDLLRTEKLSQEQFNRAMEQAKEKMEGANSGAVDLTQTLVGLAASLGVASQVNFWVYSLNRLERIAAQTDATLGSIGNAAGVTTDQLVGMAEEVENLTASEAESFHMGANLLLTFKEIKNVAGEGNDMFNRTSKAMVDLARTMDQSGNAMVSHRGAAMQLGKAMEDPIRGVTALRRAGISFTKSQQQQIKSLVESNNLLEAQRVVIEEVERQVGGSAKAFGETTTGQIALSKHAAGTFGEALMSGVIEPIRLAVRIAREVLNGLAVAIGYIPGPLRTVLSLLVGFAAVVGPITFATMALRKLLTLLIGAEAIKEAGGLWKMMTGGVKGFLGALITSPITMWAVAIAGAISLLALWRKALLDSSEAVKVLNDQMKLSEKNSQLFTDQFRQMLDEDLKKAGEIDGGAKKEFLDTRRKEYEKVMAALESQIADLKPKLKSSVFGGDMSLKEELGDLAGVNPARANNRKQLALLEEHVRTVKTSINRLKQEASGVGGGSTNPEVISGIKELNDKLKEQSVAFGLTGTAAEVAKMKLKGASEAQLAYARSVDIAHKVQQMDKEIETYGMDERTKKLYEAEEANKSLVKSTEEMKDRMKKIAEEINTTRIGMDDLTEMKEKVRKQTAGLFGSETLKLPGIEDAIMKINPLTKEMEENRAKTRSLNTEYDLFSDGLKKVNEEWRKMKERMDKLKLAEQVKEAVEANRKLLEEGKRTTEQFLTPQEKYAERMAQLDEQFRAGAIGVDTYARAIESAAEDLEEAGRNAKGLKEELKGIGTAEFGSAEALARIDAFKNSLAKPLAGIVGGDNKPDLKAVNERRKEIEKEIGPIKLLPKDDREKDLSGDIKKVIDALGKPGSPVDPETLKRVIEEMSKAREDAKRGEAKTAPSAPPILPPAPGVGGPVGVEPVIDRKPIEPVPPRLSPEESKQRAEEVALFREMRDILIDIKNKPVINLKGAGL